MKTEKRCNHRTWQWLIIIAVAAFVLRLIVGFELAAANGGRNSVLNPSRYTDLATYIDLSRQIAAGTFTGEFYYQPYYYAVFLPFLRICGIWSPYVVMAAQALAGALAVLFAGVCGRMLFGRGGGLAAAVLCAISTPLLLYTPFCQNETIQSFHLILLFFCVLKIRCAAGNRRAFMVWSALSGLVLGVAVLTRGNALLFLPGIMLFVICCQVPWRRKLAGLSLLLTLFIALQMPFAIHNSRIRGKITGPSTAADAVLALGNTPEAPAIGRNPGLPAGAMEYPETYHDFIKRAATRPVSAQMRDYLWRRPGEFLELQWRKVLWFWDFREVPNNVSLYGEGEESLLLRLLLPGRSAVVLTLAVAGVIFFAVRAFRRRRYDLLLLYYMVVCYWGATALFYILSRFRAPIIPLAAIFGGAFAVRLYRVRHDRKVMKIYLLSLLAGLFIVVCAVDFYNNYCSNALNLAIRPDGIVYQLADGRILHLDHGPFTDGDWDVIVLKPGLELEKKFAAMPPGKVDGEVQFSVLGKRSERISGKLNGKPFVMILERDGVNEFREKIAIVGGMVRLEVDSLQGSPLLLYDRRRNYGRSRVGGDGLDGEFVMRLRRMVPECVR